MRRYDTRAARKPVAEWKQISKGNGIGAVSKGHNEQCDNKPLFLSNARDKFPVRYSFRTRRAAYSLSTRVTDVLYTATKVCIAHGSLVLTIYTIV